MSIHILRDKRRQTLTHGGKSPTELTCVIIAILFLLGLPGSVKMTVFGVNVLKNKGGPKILHVYIYK